METSRAQRAHSTRTPKFYALHVFASFTSFVSRSVKCCGIWLRSLNYSHIDSRANNWWSEWRRGSCADKWNSFAGEATRKQKWMNDKRCVWMAAAFHHWFISFHSVKFHSSISSTCSPLAFAYWMLHSKPSFLIQLHFASKYNNSIKVK